MKENTDSLLQDSDSSILRKLKRSIEEQRWKLNAVSWNDVLKNCQVLLYIGYDKQW